jgi:DHA1 family tetracycline resistance protein-like MFS transporter
MNLRQNFIFAPALLMDMSTSSAILGMTFHAYKLGASPFMVGITASISTLFYVFFSRIFGKLSDRIGRKRVPQIAALCFSLLYFLMPQTKSLTQLLIMFPFTGLILSAYWSPYEAWIGELEDKRPLEKRVRMFNLAWTGGVMIGYATGGYMQEINYTIPFYFAGIGSFLAMTVLSLQPKPIKLKNAHNSEHFETPEFISQQQLTTKFLHISWIAIFFCWITISVLRYIFPKLITEIEMSASAYSLLMLVWSGTQWIMFYILGATKRWHHKFSIIAMSQILGCIGFIIIYLTNFPALWVVALIFIGIQSGMIYFSSIYYSLSGHADRGNKSGWHECILASGGLIGPFIAGALANYISIKSPYIFCAMVISIGLIVQVSYMRFRKFRNDDDQTQ